MPAALILGTLASLAAPVAAPAEAATIRAIEVQADSITLRFDEEIHGASSFLVDSPQRLAIDVPGVDLPGVGASGIGASGGGASGGGGAAGPVTAIRHGRSGGAARVVFDLAEPTVVTGGRFAEDGRSLTLALKPVDAGTFSGAARVGRKRYANEMALTGGTERGAVNLPLDAAKPYVAPTARVRGGRSAAKPLVVIDAGHGGHDPGSLSADGGRREKDVTLAIARAIRDELLASGRVRVALTREDDRFLVLGERREIARRLGADLFISVHADSAPNPTAHGATVYTLSEVASNRVAAQLAAKENRADVLNGVNLGRESGEVSSILLDLAQRETMNVSSAFANLLQREMGEQIGFRTNFHQFAGFIVLKAPDVPSVLLETGYMTNEGDLQQLFSRKYQRDIAQGVRRAVEVHFARRLKRQEMALRD